MFRLAVSQVTTHRGRYTAMVLAILVGIAFFTASLAAVSSAKATLNASLGAELAGSTVVVTDPLGEQEAITAELADQIEQLDAVESTHIGLSSYGRITELNGSERSTVLQALPQNPAQQPIEIISGEVPTGATQVAVDTGSAQEYGIEIGEQLTVNAIGTEGEVELEVTVTGMFPTLQSPTLLGFIQLFGTENLVQASSTGFNEQLLVRTTPQEATATVQAIQTLLDEDGFDAVTVMTVPDYVDYETTVDGGFVPLTVVLLMFAGIAVAVMMLVINNTFAVIVAQRTRELGLLRLVGATKAQLFRMVITEAAVIGLLASVVGMLLGLGLLAGALYVAGAVWDISFISFDVEPLEMVLPLVLGTLATVAAAWRPARQATRVVPVQALAPELMQENTGNIGWVRTIFGGLFFLAGSAALVFFVFITPELLLAVLSGLVSFIGILMLTPVFIPPLVKLVGWLAKPFGLAGSQARVNAARHPRRTATTAAALLIGTTLVMMMVTGAETIKREINETLNEFSPLDVVLQLPVTESSGSETVAQAQQRVQAQLENSSELVRSHVGEAVVIPTLDDVSFMEIPVHAVDAEALDNVSRLNGAVPAPGEMFTYSAEPGTQATIDGNEFAVKDNPYSMAMNVVVNAADFAGEPTSASMVVMSLSKDIDPAQMENFRDELAHSLGVEPADIQGSMFERMLYTQIINTVLSVVNALLAVALVIAFIGVANTLTLSTIERRKENGLLRAIGLTRGGLRSMLVLEAVLISVVAVVVGSALGVLYGWFGANAVMSGMLEVGLMIPWSALVLVIIAAVLCAMLAAAVPAHRSLKLSPVQALTE